MEGRRIVWLISDTSSSVRLSSVVCRLSLTFVNSTQAIEIFGNVEYSDFGPVERYISETVQDRS